jgi:hypothetical protein
VTWARPVIVNEAGLELQVFLRRHTRGQISFEIAGSAGGGLHGPTSPGAVYSRGYAGLAGEDRAPRLDIEALRARCRLELRTAEHCYAVLSRGEMSYGPAQQGLLNVAAGVDNDGNPVALARLRPQWNSDTARYVVHPCIVDSALQAAVALAPNGCVGEPTPARLPFFVGRVRVWAPTAHAVWAYLRLAEGREAPRGMKLSLDICAADGTVCMQARDFCFRPCP